MSTVEGTFPSSIRAVLKAEPFSLRIKDVFAAKSAQQQVWIVTLMKDNVHPEKNKKNDWTINARRIVVRVWKAACRWWNLNRPPNTYSLLDIARAEIWGYRRAKQALGDHGKNLLIPGVLYFCECDKPWAVMEYVADSDNYSAWSDGMVTERKEFGFVEPHPRWGRVPVDSALEYAMIVLENVVLPLHRGSQPSKGDVVAENRSPITHSQMVSLYRTNYDWLMTDWKDHATSPFSASIQALGRALDKLSSEPITNLEPVVCHMDLQPQNIMFAARTRIRTVLDWEEAEFADPRFELLLLGRKVCANKQQAASIWRRYELETKISLGEIEPWLLLETVHSMITLLLQSFSGGGRSPWESKPDLIGKLEREQHRLGNA